MIKCLLLLCFFFHFVFVLFKFDFASFYVLSQLYGTCNNFLECNANGTTQSINNSMMVQQPYKTNLQKMVMFRKRNRIYILEQIHIIKKLTMDGLNNKIKHKKEENNFMNVLRIMYYDSDRKQWFYFKRLIALPIIFCDIVYFDMKQRYVWQKQCVKVKTKNKLQEKRKDNENNRKEKKNRNGASYFNQCVLKYKNINAILNDFNTFLGKVECYQSDDINMIAKYTNIFKINLNDETQSVDLDLILNGIILGNTDNIAVEFRFNTNMLIIFWLLLLLLVWFKWYNNVNSNNCSKREI